MEKKNTQVKVSTEHRVKTPWHLWVMGLFFIFIFANGVYDYFMMLGHNVDYYNSKHYGEAVVKYFTNYPKLCLLFYTLNVFCGLISSILLLFKTKWAMRCAFVSAVSMICLDILTYTFRNRWNVFGTAISVFDIALLLMTCGFFFYCRVLTKRGVLK